MNYYTILEATHLLIAQYGWTLRRCRRRYDDGPLRYVLLDGDGTVVKDIKLDRRRRYGLSLNEILTLLAEQENPKLSEPAIRLLRSFDEITDLPSK